MSRVVRINAEQPYEASAIVSVGRYVFGACLVDSINIDSNTAAVLKPDTTTQTYDTIPWDNYVPTPSPAGAAVFDPKGQVIYH